MKKFYVTTAIPYVNAAPHIGHALEFVETDVIARFHRLLGEKVRFLTGTDDNALKNVQAAEEKGIKVEELVKKNADIFENVVRRLNCSIDDFIRTTEKRHIEGAQAFWLACKKEDIYKKSYQGLYCVGCETFYLEKDLVEGKCPEHKKKPEVVKEENYFFRLSVYQDWLLKLIESDELKIVPEFRKNEVVSFIKGGLEDFSISRSVKRAKGWGIPVPEDPEQIIYVWFDALTNYITALNWQNNDPLFGQFWPADVQVIGKGITRFHAIYWPAMLKSAGLPPPKEIFVHGYVTAEGEKISKSLGIVIDPLEYIEKYGVDAVRYYLLKEIPSYNDGDFSQSRFVEVYNSELANNLGNLVSRVCKLGDKLQITNYELRIDEEFKKLINQCSFDLTVKWVFEKWIDPTNVRLNETTPWKLEATDPKRIEILTECVSNLRQAAYHLLPFIPETAQKILDCFAGEIKPLPKALFPRIETNPSPADGLKTPLGSAVSPPTTAGKLDRGDGTNILSSDRRYWVDEKATKVGVKFQVAEIYGVTVKKKNPELEKDKKAIAELVRKTDYSRNPILLGYEKLYVTAGVKNAVASPTSLLQLVKEKGVLPTINTVVDAYNVKSLKTKLVVSAHDLDKLKGDVRIETTTGKEVFYPLGSTTGETLPVNEWAAVDDVHTLCRLNCKQSELSKVTQSTKNLLIYVQGSEATSDEYLHQSLVAICENVVKYNGGKYVVLKEKV